MKILYLSYCVGNTSSGICSYKKISGLLAKKCELCVVTSSCSVDICVDELKYYKISCFINRPSLLFEQVGNLIKRDITYYFWKRRAKSKIDKLLKSWWPDVVYADSFPPPTFGIAYYIKKKYGISYILHFTDPIPAPIIWKTGVGYRTKMYKEIEKPVKYAKKLSFGNESMLEYEQGLFDCDIKNKSFISPDPHIASLVSYPVKYKEKKRFVFFGSFYGNRNPSELFKAFDKLVSSDPNFELWIYDNKSNVFNKKEYSKNIGKSILFVGRTKEFQSVFTEADYLIDMDGYADSGQEVYLSNKLKEYLRVNRPILSITSASSPAEKLLEGLDNVVISRHNSENIYQAFIDIINNKYNSYENRLSVIRKFDVDNIVECILKEIE